MRVYCSQGGEQVVNIELLEQEMDKQNISDYDIAKAIKKDITTWYRRKAAPNTIQIGEAEEIVKFMNLSKRKSILIFLP